MNNTVVFETMKGLTSAIKQIDSVVEQNKESMLEDALIAVKDINIDKMDDDIKKNIVNNLRRGLLEMYKTQQEAANREIGLGVSFTDIDNRAMDGVSVDSNILKERKPLQDPIGYCKKPVVKES